MMRGEVSSTNFEKSENEIIQRLNEGIVVEPDDAETVSQDKEEQLLCSSLQSVEKTTL